MGKPKPNKKSTDDNHTKIKIKKTSRKIESCEQLTENEKHLIKKDIQKMMGHIPSKKNQSSEEASKPPRVQGPKNLTSAAAELEKLLKQKKKEKLSSTKK